MAEDVKKLTKEFTSEARKRGMKVAAVKHLIEAAASDAALLARARDAANAGEAIDWGLFDKLRASADSSRVALFGEDPKHVTSIQVELVPAPAQFTRLQDECAALRLRVAELESALAQVPANALDGAPSVQPLSSDGQSAAPPAPDNVIPLVESREQRIARLRRENGDLPQACRSAFSPDTYERPCRFDFPTGRGGW